MTNYDSIIKIGSDVLRDILTVSFLEGALSVKSICDDKADRICKISPSDYDGGDIEEFFDSDFAEMIKCLYEKYLNADTPDDGLHMPILKYICDDDV